MAERSEAVPEDKKNMKILMIGLDLAGKTTILYRFKLGKVVPTIPSLGYNVEIIDYKSFNFEINDIGGKSTIRALWMFYLKNNQAMIYVVDSSDQEKMDEARTELMKVLAQDEVKDIPLLIYANKQDLPNAVNTAEIIDKLDLHSLKNRNWYIQAISATSGDGLYKGLDWLVNQLENQKS